MELAGPYICLFEDMLISWVHTYININYTWSSSYNIHVNARTIIIYMQWTTNACQLKLKLLKSITLICKHKQSNKTNTNIKHIIGWQTKYMMHHYWAWYIDIYMNHVWKRCHLKFKMYANYNFNNIRYSKHFSFAISDYTIRHLM